MKKIRYGLIGCGDIAVKRVIPALQSLRNCELLSVARKNQSLVESFAKTHNIPKWFETWKELIEDKDIDAVYIATPHFLHRDQAVAAANAGKHVLCEKPMAMNTKECKEIIDACNANKVKFGVAYYRHFYDSIKRIKEIINSGSLGDISVAHINAFENNSFNPGDKNYWYKIKEFSGGGPMMSAGCHRIEVLINIFGTEFEVTSKIESTNSKTEVDSDGVAMLHFSSGTIGIVCVSDIICEKVDSLDIFGSEGSIHVRNLNEGSIHLLQNDKSKVEYHPPHLNLHQPLIKDFTESVIENREPQVGGGTGMTVQTILDSVYNL